MTATICLRKQGDTAGIERLLDTAFGTDRARKLSYAYRQGLEPIWPLSFSAHEGDRLVGTISAWPIAVGDSTEAAILLGPIAVDTEVRGAGLGSALVRECLLHAGERGFGLALLVGDMAYYGRFGFVPAAGFGIEMTGENPDRLLALPLRPGPVASGTLKHWRLVRLRKLAA
jgi:predicted N-acetyltransferase YhbS